MMLNEHYCVRFSPFVNPSIFTMFNHGGNQAYGGVGDEPHTYHNGKGFIHDSPAGDGERRRSRSVPLSAIPPGILLP
jgi:hypothetical protein